ncbi:MAG TPA: hypothetical protein VM347_35690 [Nonomuraea sp.]|nr:hypothetical protein [Nonomuraea sp.]
MDPQKKQPFLAQFAREDLAEQPEVGSYDESQQINVAEGEAIPTIATDEGRKTMASLPRRRLDSAQSEDGETDLDNNDG